MNDQVSQWLCGWFADKKKIKRDAPPSLEANYFDAGLLTSLEVIEFISEIEDHFGIQFSEHDFQDPRFVTIAGLAELIAGRSARGVESQSSERL